MAWNITAVAAPASSVKLDPTEEVQQGVEEMFEGLSTAQRGIVGYDSTEDRDAARSMIRTYCESRKDGRLTASIWAGYTDAEGTGKWSLKETDKMGVPALSLAFTVYVKKEKTSEEASSTPE